MPGADPRPDVRWGIGDFFAGWIGSYVLTTLLTPLALAATGVDTDTPSKDWPIRAVALTQLVFGASMLLAAVVITTRRGRGPVADLGLRARLEDVPLGIAAGIAAQVVGNALYLPIYWLTDYTTEDVNGPATNLTDRAHGPAQILLLVLAVAIVAPIAEEVLYRGVLLRAVERRTGSAPWAVVLSSAFFAMSHLEGLQLPALFVFGLVVGTLAVRTGRLGPGIVAHMAFNATAVWYLLR